MSAAVATRTRTKTKTKRTFKMSKFQKIMLNEVRGELLERLILLRALNAPRVMIRHRQLSLWALRQVRQNPSLLFDVYDLDPDFLSLNSFPGWQANYQKFVMIHKTLLNQSHQRPN